MPVDRRPNVFTAKQKIDRSVTDVTRKRQLCDDRHYAPVFAYCQDTGLDARNGTRQTTFCN
jgi:hypothetical protein